MAKVRIHEIAKDSGFESKDVLAKARELGIDVKTASSSVDEEVAAAIYEYLQTNKIPEAFAKKESKSKSKKEVVAKNEKQVKNEEKITAKKENKKEPKEETTNKKEENKDEIEETQPQTSIRRGLVIVKKKNNSNTNIQNETKQEQKTVKSIDLKDMFSNAQDENLSKKVKKKDKKQVAQSKKENAQKVDILGNKDFADISLDDEDIVVLPEFSTKIEQNTQSIQNKKQPSLLRQSFTKFTENSIQRRARKKAPKKVEKKRKFRSKKRGNSKRNSRL